MHAASLAFLPLLVSIPAAQIGLAAAIWSVWLYGTGLLVYGRRYYPPLASLAVPQNLEGGLPSLTIVVPACNEADSIEQGMLSLLALNYPCLEVIAVDDRSSDATGAILDKLAANYPRLKVIHIRELPPHWLGKNHALQAASDQAMGDWLLFTDADVIMRADAMNRAVAYAQAAGIDHLVLSPRCDTHGFWERLFVSYFGIMFSFKIRPWEVKDTRKQAYVGLGSFNLVRASAYRAIGGHRALAMDVSDDMKLGKLLKRAGFIQALLDGDGLLTVRWVIGLRGIVEGLTKNAFAGFDYHPGALATAAVSLGIVSILPLICVFTPPTSVRIVSGLTLLTMAYAAHVLRRLSGAPWWYGLGYPVASFVLIYILCRSMSRAYRQKGIIWRGTLYPLDELKRGVV